MSDFEPTNPEDETLSGPPVSTATSAPSPAETSGATPPPPPASSPDGSASAPTARQARRPRLRRLLANKRRRWIVVTAAAMCAVIGLSVGVVTSRSTTAANPVAASGIAGGNGSGGGAPNARSGPATGGASGTVASVSPSGFTMTTSAGQKVTVDEASATTYQNGTNSASASDIATGPSVLALGMTNGTTITATQVIVTPAGGDASASSSAASVIPFQSGAPTASQQVGQIPANWNQGSGTIVSGTTADKATQAALAAYPGGIVDRVVQLSTGQYNVHFIGVNWPHHVFVDQNFNVVGAL
ncbi:MAG: hypothetical protein QOE57_2848 [Acidimicrobiaceae bacterium]|nr:hypothetical protein [Acidimicrobiaceae bacterium]